jgi:phosphopantetheine adenylyltransferase
MSILFIGKFQPPHLGHVLTINKLIKKYKKITIGITEGRPKFFERKKIKSIFESIYYNQKKINIVLLYGAVDEKTIKIDKKYKLIISGNKLILKILNKLNFKTKYQSRTGGYGFSGRLLRAKMKK